MMRSTLVAFRSIALSLALTTGIAGVANAQTLPPDSPQSAVLASGLRKAFAAAQTATPSGSQTTAAPSSDPYDDWKVGIYPIFVWLPFGIGIDVTVPPDDNGQGGGSGEIVDSRFDGAYLGGFYTSKGRFRVDADGIWAGFGGDRPDNPFLQVDADVVYFHVTGGVRLVKDLYATAGVRRLAMTYDIDLADFPTFERKPGVWDPVIGVAWHTEGNRGVEFHATFEGGGFGVGTESELSGSARVDLKPWKHFGFTAGYAFLHLRLEDTVRNRTFELKQTLHGPLIGIGLYF
jgi:hypothetical protein